MNLREWMVRRRGLPRLALGGFRLALCLTFVALGSGLTAGPELAVEPGMRFLPGGAHVAVGIGLLIPGYVAATSWIGTLVVWATVPLLPEAAAHPLVPSLLTLALLALIVGTAIRRRRHEAAWRAMLLRYADGRGVEMVGPGE